nr:MAG TPA: hypothetical protein [Caudoviricetes sp.]
MPVVLACLLGLCACLLLAFLLQGAHIGLSKQVVFSSLVGAFCTIRLRVLTF